jgi:hypothetical protein
LSESTLTFSVQVKQKAELLCQVPDRADGVVDAKMRCAGVVDWDLEHELAATIKFAQ